MFTTPTLIGKQAKTSINRILSQRKEKMVLSINLTSRVIILFLLGMFETGAEATLETYQTEETNRQLSCQ